MTGNIALFTLLLTIHHIYVHNDPIVLSIGPLVCRRRHSNCCPLVCRRGHIAYTSNYSSFYVAGDMSHIVLHLHVYVTKDKSHIVHLYVA